MRAWQATVQDEAGNAVFNPQVTVYQEDGSTLADIFNEDGSSKENPFIGTTEGFAQFWAERGTYKVVGANGGVSETWQVDLADKAALELADSAIATQARRDFATYNLTDYLHPDDLEAALTGNLSGQIPERITASVRLMHDDALSWLLGGSNRWVIHKYPTGRFRVTDELFSEWHADALYNATEAERRVTFLFDNTCFQCFGWTSNRSVRTSGYWAERGVTHPVPKALFRWESRVGSSNLAPYISGFLTLSGGGNPETDPVAFKVRGASGVGLSNVRVTGFHNIGFDVSRLLNSDVYNFVAYSVGWQPTDRAIGHSVRVSNAGASVTATEPTFAPGDVGRWFGLDRAGPPQEFRAGSVRTSFWSTISSYISPTEVTLSEAPSTDVSDALSSFESIRADTTAGSNQITISGPVDTDMVGRNIYICRARAQGSSERDGILPTYVVAQSGVTLTLAHALNDTKTDCPVIVSPIMSIGGDAYEDGPTVDDVTFHNLGLETRDRGVVPLVVSGRGVADIDFSAGSKFHGTGGVQNFGASFALTAVSRAGHLNFNGLMEHGGHSPRYGKHMVLGSDVSMDLQGSSVGYPDSNRTALAYLAPPDIPGKRVQLRYGMIENASVWPVASQVYSRTADGGDPLMMVSGASLLARSHDQTPDLTTVLGPVRASSLAGTAVTFGQSGGLSGSRVMAVGFGGNTGSVQPAYASDYNNMIGQHRRVRSNASTLNRPDDDSYLADIMVNNGDLCIQIAYSLTAPGKVALRSNNAGSWSAWRFLSGQSLGGGRPAHVYLGQMYFDTTLGLPIWWNGTAWVDATGATV